MKEISVSTNKPQSNYKSETKCARGCHCGTDTVYSDEKPLKTKVKKDLLAHQFATQTASNTKGSGGFKLETNAMEARRKYLEQNPEEAKRWAEMEEVDKITGIHRKAVKSVLKRRRHIPKEVLSNIKFQFQKYLDRYKLPWHEKLMPSGINAFEQSIELFVSETGKVNDAIRESLEFATDTKTIDDIQVALDAGEHLIKRMQKFHADWGHLVRKSVRIKRTYS